MPVPAAGGVLTSAVAHIDLVVGDLDRSLAFYRGLLEPLGWRPCGTIEGESGAHVVYLEGPCGAQLGLREGVPRPPDRRAIGLHHLAFRTASRADVVERWRWLRRRGAAIESDPSERDYAPGYFATFFLDPDGLKLELVHTP